MTTLIIFGSSVFKVFIYLSGYCFCLANCPSFLRTLPSSSIVRPFTGQKLFSFILTIIVIYLFKIHHNHISVNLLTIPDFTEPIFYKLKYLILRLTILASFSVKTVNISDILPCLMLININLHFKIEL